MVVQICSFLGITLDLGVLPMQHGSFSSRLFDRVAGLSANVLYQTCPVTKEAHFVGGNVLLGCLLQTRCVHSTCMLVVSGLKDVYSLLNKHGGLSSYGVSSNTTNYSFGFGRP